MRHASAEQHTSHICVYLQCVSTKLGQISAVAAAYLSAGPVNHSQCPPSAIASFCWVFYTWDTLDNLTQKVRLLFNCLFNIDVFRFIYNQTAAVYNEN